MSVSHKRFSSLSPKKKDEVFQNVLDMSMGTIDLPKGLRTQITSQIPSEKMASYQKVFEKMIKKQYVFIYEGMTFPMNVREIKNELLTIIKHTNQ